MKINAMTDPSFREYGQIVEGYDKEELLAILRSEMEIAETMAYVPKDERLMRLPIAREISERFYGGMPVALGWVSGHNTKLNCLEYHRDSELNLGTEDFILLLGKRMEIEEDGTYDTGKVKAFLIPAGVMVEIYATTLHYAPCQANDYGFRVFAVLPDGSNTEKPEIVPVNAEDRLLFARNKWLIAHPDSQEAAAGAFAGLKGTNIDISKNQNVLVTGTGREMALGFQFVRRYLEQGDVVFACVRKPSEALERLKAAYEDRLHVLIMDISDTASVKAAAGEAALVTDHLDVLINNAVTTAPDCMKDVLEADPDQFAPAMNVGAAGALRVIQAFYPLLKKSSGTALVVNISSEAGSIGTCYRTGMTDYAITKAAVNMITKTLWNVWKDDEDMNILCVHPGWVRTNEGNALAPFDSYEQAETLRLLFETRRNVKDGNLFLTYAGEVYPW